MSLRVSVSGSVCVCVCVCVCVYTEPVVADPSAVFNVYLQMSVAVPGRQ